MRGRAAATPDDFEAAYPELFVRAMRAGRRIVGDRGEAEDIAAETMARAFARWPRIRGYAPAWVVRVASNLALDAVRRRPAGPPPPEPAPDRAAERLVTYDELRRLPRRQRQALVLRFVLDLDEQEAAAVLGIGVATLHTHVKRGLGRMRAALLEPPPDTCRTDRGANG